jgi:hypothetical protein
MDMVAVGAAALYTAATTVRSTGQVAEQIKQAVLIARGGARLFVASLLPVESPDEMSSLLAAAVIAVMLGLLGLAVVRLRRAGNRGTDGEPLRRWLGVAAVALVALGLCWVVYIPGAFFTPAFPGLESRVNILALYPMVVLVYALLRSLGYLAGPHGRLVALAGCGVIALGYAGQSLAEERDWARSARLQDSVLAGVGLASPPSGSLVLTFGHPAQVAPAVPVFQSSYDLWSAAQLRTKNTTVDTYPVFTGAEFACSSTGITMTRLVSPRYGEIDPRDNGTALTRRYPNVIFVDVYGQRSMPIRSRAECRRAVSAFTPGPWRGRSLSFSLAGGRGSTL